MVIRAAVPLSELGITPLSLDIRPATGPTPPAYATPHTTRRAGALDASLVELVSAPVLPVMPMPPQRPVTVKLGGQIDPSHGAALRYT